MLVADGIAPERIVVVHSGVALDESATATPDSACATRLGLAPRCADRGQRRARWSPHKDHATLLRAAALLREPLPDLHWVIAGEGPSRAAPGAAPGRARARATVSTFWVTSPSPPGSSRMPMSSS